MIASGEGRQDLLVAAVEGMARPLFVLAEDWTVSYVNRAGARLLGRTVDKLEGRNLWTEFPAAVGSPFEMHYRRVAETGEPASFEARFEPTGVWFQVDAVRTDGGVVVTYDDVSERHRTEAARADAVQAQAEAVRRAERTGEHLRLLGDISHTLTLTQDVEDGVARLAELCIPLLADWSLVTLVTGGTRRDVGRAHRDPTLRGQVDVYADLRAAGNRGDAPVPTLFREGRPVVIQELTQVHLATMVDDASRAALVPLDPGSVAAFPLLARGELFGALTLVHDRSRGPFTPEELNTAELAARRASVVLDNARLVAAQGRVAERLQRSLLSAPVQPDRLEIAVRYLPATDGLSIGGDWYDAFLQPDGDTVLVIGDVSGHDIEAAAVMAQLKTLVRAIAYDRIETPAQVLRRVDLAVAGLDVPTMTTALVARVEQDAAERVAGIRRLRWSTAGHPQPMLLLADGTVADLDCPVGPPLGIGSARSREDGEVLLPPGSTLLLCTDGLFERRATGLDEGRAALRAALARQAGRPLGALCDGLLGEMLCGRAEDDVALLAVRAHPEDRPRPPEAGPERLPGAKPAAD